VSALSRTRDTASQPRVATTTFCPQICAPDCRIETNNSPTNHEHACLDQTPCRFHAFHLRPSSTSTFLPPYSSVSFTTCIRPLQRNWGVLASRGQIFGTSTEEPDDHLFYDDFFEEACVMLPRQKGASNALTSCYPAQNTCDGLGVPFMTDGLMALRLQLLADRPEAARPFLRRSLIDAIFSAMREGRTFRIAIAARAAVTENDERTWIEFRPVKYEF